jgi:hypothetical protein
MQVDPDLPERNLDVPDGYGLAAEVVRVVGGVAET